MAIRNHEIYALGAMGRVASSAVIVRLQMQTNNRVRDVDGFCDNFSPLTNQTKTKQTKPNKTKQQSRQEAIEKSP